MLSAIALASIVSSSSCSWDEPGANRFLGDLPSAVQDYEEIPADVRAELQRKLQAHWYDDQVRITRDSIQGADSYENLRSMHFGQNRLCRTVSRAAWRPDAVERGLVYCVQAHCVLVPSICGNLSLVTRSPRPLRPEPPLPRPEAPPTPPLALTEPPRADASFASSSAPIERHSSSAWITVPIVAPSFSVQAYVSPQIPCAPVTSPVPEPTTLALLGFGILTLFLLTRHR